MKTIAKVACIFLFIGFVANSHAQKKEEVVSLIPGLREVADGFLDYKLFFCLLVL